jgi:hypothetical protein
LSLPPSRTGDAAAIWPAFVSWAARYTSGLVLSAVVHLDQSHPHCHLLLLPVVGRKWVGSRLLTNFQSALASFDADVGATFGLHGRATLESPETPLVAAAMAELDGEHGDDYARLGAAIRAAVAASPAVFLAALGKLPSQKLPAKSPASNRRGNAKSKLKTMTAIFTSTGRKTSEDKAQKRVQKGGWERNCYTR